MRCDACDKEKPCLTIETRYGKDINICSDCLLWSNNPDAVLARKALQVKRHK